jgi:hypothetical protein
MARTQTASHPFALLIDPQSVIQAVEKSQRLDGLQRRVCRPLDKPLLPMLGGATAPELDDDEDLPLTDESFDADADSDLGPQNL